MVRLGALQYPTTSAESGTNMQHTKNSLGTWLIALVVATASIACEESRECERERLALTKTFEQLQLSAAKAKVLGEERAQAMESAAKKDHVDRWTALETHAALLHSAVMTQQVTWDSAENALKKSHDTYQATTHSAPFEQAFGPALVQANAAFSSFKDKCR